MTQLRGMCQSEEMGGISQADLNRNKVLSFYKTPPVMVVSSVS